jgi:hypothetical protein
MALGASHWRLARQFLTESLLLAAMGALTGIPLAYWLGRSLLWMLPPIGFPLELDFSLNADILVFIVLLCWAGSLLTGLTPLYTIKRSLMDALKEGGRSGTSGTSQNRTSGLLVVSEVALALVALVGTALLARSFQNARAIHPGFDARKCPVCEISPRYFLPGPRSAGSVLPASARSHQHPSGRRERELRQ